MIQDIAPHRLYNEYRPSCRPESGNHVYVFRRSSFLCRIDAGKIILPMMKDLPESMETIYLFSIDDEPYFLGIAREEFSVKDMDYRDIRSLRNSGLGPKELDFATVTAFQLARWYSDNRYCGTCGEKTVHSGKERALCCPSCGRKIYPHIQPAVIVGVIDQDRLLMTKYSDRDLSFYALVAGFTEIGETLEQTVQREVMEEVGLKVKNIRYYKSQPWGVADDLLVGFYCDVDGDPTVRIDHSELKIAVWMPREEIEGQPDNISLTSEMMLRFRDGLENVKP